MDLISKALLMGLGVVDITREKAERLIDDLVKRGEVASEERYKMIDKLLKQVDEQEKRLMQIVSETVKKTVSEMGLPTKDDMEKILKRLDDIEKKNS
jgi:polyhydroxyalkanoate synthesis regulator phasin|uniref:Polyhydroxyalkanoate synthesis regulator n=1 Tax=Thermodesulfobium narugense TaxID=184064 RepID=A0A7C5KCB2_9BACT